LVMKFSSVLTLFLSSNSKSSSESMQFFSGTVNPIASRTKSAFISNSLSGIISQLLVPNKDGKGRHATYEILVRTTALPNLIRDGSVSKLFSYMQTGLGSGMITMDQSIRRIFDDGMISAKEARMRAVDKDHYKDDTPEKSGTGGTGNGSGDAG
jgi:twitching motility protein PilT